MSFLKGSNTFLCLKEILIYLTYCLCFYFIFKTFIKPTLYWRNKVHSYVNPYKRFFKIFLTNRSFLESVREAYEDDFPNQRYYGSYQFFQPSLFVRDLDLIKKITVKDFEYFHDHSSISNERSDPIVTQNLFSLKGEKWKRMRTTLTPAFTSSKMRQMFVLMNKAAENTTRFIVDRIEEQEKIEVEVEMKDFYSKYTNDVIASCAFGIHCNSLLNEDNDFFQMGKYFSSTFKGWRVFRALINAFFPSLAGFLGISLFPAFVSEFFKKIVKDTISFRERKQIVRPDLIHLLMQSRKGLLKADSSNLVQDVGFASKILEKEDCEYLECNTDLTDDLITAQALVFFIAGFETSSSILSLLSYELARNPDIQRKLQTEIDEYLKKTSGEWDYECILKMKYLDQVISETLRMYPPAFALNRICTKDYFIPAIKSGEKDLVVEKGCLVVIPTYGIHMSPEYFPDPDRFDPDRFCDANKTKIIPGTYLPFGRGPRNCIGSRFALLEIKALVVYLFSYFNVKPTKNTKFPVQFDKSGILRPKHGIWLAFEKRLN